MNLRELKSGTDIRGKAMGENAGLTPEAVRRITAAYVLFLERRLGKPAGQMTVAVGHDPRLSSGSIREQVVAVLTSKGVRVLDCGLSSTPAMFMIIADGLCDSSVMITASHLPADRNGLKFFLKSGGLEGSDIDEILDLTVEDAPVAANASLIEKCGYMTAYADHLRQLIIDGTGAKMPLKGFKIAVDAGNGSGGFYAKNVLEPLGADVSGSVFLEPDGSFPNHMPNPEDAAAMRAISEAVTSSKSDLGVIFDTDVDRAAVVDGDGREINRDRLVALASCIALEGNEGGTIVTDSVTTDGLKDFIENELGGRQRRFKRGYKNVINEAIRLNNEGVNCPLAIETSGHAAMRENYFLDDGAYLATKIIILAARLREQGKTIGELISGLREPRQEIEARYRILSPDFRAYGLSVLDALEKFGNEADGVSVVPDSAEGVRLSFDNGWLLLRLSVHDPVLPLNIASDDDGGADKIFSLFNQFISSFSELERQ